MGCNSSKNEDVAQSRTRDGINTSPKAAPQAIHPSSPKPPRSASYAISPKQNRVEIPPADSSYTDRKVIEREFFKELIERATSKFIDVADQPISHDSASYQEFTKLYSDRLSRMVISAAHPSFMMLPRCSTACANPRALLSDEGISQEDLQYMSKTTSRVDQAFSEFRLQSRGQLIVPFPPLE
eukprot:TRINITY_DN5673_c0_g1_i1.p1 TRINITY_DN5673_c0_g1~~TRINITY_DN5673_c0_g1_i1.p1  ORF type:complete len:183 (+),score=40.54 TRINITY_DN5673_c0_g1_i1:65-613(+)